MPPQPAPPRMIDRRHVFGVCEKVKDGFQYLDDTNVVWVAGKSLVVLDTQLGTQQLIPCTPSCNFVTALAISYNRRLLAVAESSKFPCIVIYVCDMSGTPKLKRKKLLQVLDLGSTEYVSLGFSLDGRYLISLGDHPEWNAVYWNVERAKVVASCAVLDEKELSSKDRHLLNQCSICPNDASLVCVSGQGVVRFLVQQESHLRPAAGGLREPVTKYLAHMWIPSENRLILSTENGDLIVMENNEYKYPLPISPSDGIAITTLVAYSKGFICGGDMGLICIFERTDNKEMYRKVRTFKFNNDAENMGPQSEVVPAILSLTLSPQPAEEYVSFMTSTKQLYSLNLPNADFFKSNERVFEPIGQPFHSGPVIGVDVCVQRPHAVTAGRDRCIFLWNLITGVVEFRKRFPTDIYSIAMHPSGLHLLVGLADGLRMMNLYHNDVREFKNIGIRSCVECRFSTGGQFFAAAHATTIHVYYTYTCELLGHLRGHSGKVKSIYFVPPDDTKLISVGLDGAVCEFNLCDFHKLHDNVLKAMTYNCAVADVGTVWTAGNDRKLRQFDRAKLQPVAEYDLQNASLYSMVISSKLKLLVGGAEDGTVRVFNTYLGEKFSGADRERESGGEITIESHSAHSGIVTRLALTFDESMVVSVGDDGAVIFWDVVAPYRGPQKEVEYCRELFMARADLEAATKAVAALDTEVSELKQRMLQQQIRRDRVHDEKLAKLDRERADEQARRLAQHKALKAEKNEQAIQFTEFMAEMEAKEKETLRRTKEDYSVKIESLRNRADRLRQLIDERQKEQDAHLAEVHEIAARNRAQDKECQQVVLQEMDDEHHRLIVEKEQDEKNTDSYCALIEDDTDVEVTLLKEDVEKRRKEQEEEVAILQASNDLLLSRENIIKADLEAIKADVREKLRQQTTLESQIEAAKRDIGALTQEFKDRGETIAEKERRVLDLKKKNQELEKFKFVLEYKIRELKSQIDPRDEEIRQAKSRLSEMGKEADNYIHSNEHLVLQIRSLRQKKAGQQRELDNLAESMRGFSEYLSRLWTELCDLQDEKNPRKLKESAKMLFDKYTSSKASAANKALASRTAADEVREYSRERDHLERNLAGLKNKVNKDAENNRTDKSRITTENVILIKEINDLRKEARLLAGKAGAWRQTETAGAAAQEEDAARELTMQRVELQRLRLLATKLEDEARAKGITLKLPLLGGRESRELKRR
ncbi:WDdomain 65 [Trypanosoma rangeli]|uniref:WDdomain 65 n=1 Tax=Trypanosoma rangeli TaxID=5698 RepID=A0A3R7K981_TRYRA|nr:WDdomain 65 [Trypanosoma rangeli]RNF03776.1 WDdomain 65 [Trypanosoma rangeli]|eukprot:RNF03776.1 WDdomain 65 [Trypanosoma rangeli]